jgi:hypothetical protein
VSSYIKEKLHIHIKYSDIEVMSDPEYANYESWIDRQPDGSSVIIDPFIGMPVGNEPPRLLLQNRTYAQSLEQFNSRPTAIEVVFCRHDKASDLDTDDNDPQWFERRLADPTLDAYLYERNDISPLTEMLERVDAYALHSIMRWWPRRSFDTRMKYAAVKSGAVWAPYGVVREDNVGRALGSIKAQENNLWRASKERGTRGILEAMAVHQYLSEYTFTASVGGLLERTTRHAERCNLMLTVGAAHQYFPERLRQVGAQVLTRFLRPDLYQEYWPVQNMHAIVGNGHITEEQFVSFDEVLQSTG